MNTKILLFVLFVVIFATLSSFCEEEKKTKNLTPSTSNNKNIKSDEFKTPIIDNELKKNIVFFESFQDEEKETPKDFGWVVSKHGSKDQKWIIQKNQASGKVKGLKGVNYLSTTSLARKYAISVPINSKILETIENKDEVVIQYEVKFEENLECGGAYIKLLKNLENGNNNNKLDLTEVKGDSPYIIMFGPDKCGETNKVHFILRHYNPKSKKWEEKHCQDVPKIENDAITHLYTLIIRKSDNSFEILIDSKSVRKGNLLSDKDFKPTINPPKKIDDPNDKKPKDWVDTKMIPDPKAKKPEDWDENEPQFIVDKTDKKPEDWLENESLKIPDPKAKKPEDWDDEEDGKWEPPIIENEKCKKISGCGKWKPRNIKNPKFKGKWKPPLIKNPKYIGEWKPKKINNPNYFQDQHPAQSIWPNIKAISIEIWTMNKNIHFKNFLISTNQNVAKKIGKLFWENNYQNMKEFVEKNKPKPKSQNKIVSELEKNLNLIKHIYTYAQERLGGFTIPLFVSIAAILITVPFFFIRSLYKMFFNKKKSKFTEPESDDEDEEDDDEENKENKENKDKKDKKDKKKEDKKDNDNDDDDEEEDELLKND